jgi:hypothetical protein
MVWHHRSGGKSLILAHTIKTIDGLDQAESDALLKRLMAWAERPEYIYSHHWQAGDLLIWDNTGTMHRVVPFDLACGRELDRVTLLGEENPSPARSGAMPPALAALIAKKQWDYDCITEWKLDDEAAMAEIVKLLRDPEIGKVFYDDEEHLLDRSSVRYLRCETRDTGVIALNR